MKLKGFVGAAVALAAAMLIGTGVYAEDYTFDVSAATDSGGNWGQTFKEMTPQGGDINNANNFDPCCMTEDSVIIAEFEISDDVFVIAPPAELIWQTWAGPFEPDPDVKTDWNKISAFEYTKNTAKFAYKDIVDAYGTNDFTTVYALYIGDTGDSIKLTGLTVTNIDPDRNYQTVLEEKENGTFVKITSAPDTEETTASEEAATEAETEAVTEEAMTEEVTAEETEAVEVTTEAAAAETVEETTSAETAATKITKEPGAEARRIAQNAPTTGFDTVTVVIVVVIVLAFTAAAAALYIHLKRNKKI